jgi:spore coat protein A, manganese oxidase
MKPPGREWGIIYRFLLPVFLVIVLQIPLPALAAPTLIPPSTPDTPTANVDYTQPILDGAAQFSAVGFLKELPNPFQPAYTYTKLAAPPGGDTTADWYSISMREILHANAGLVDDHTPVTPTSANPAPFAPLPPFKVWSYGDASIPGFATYPGMTFEARTGRPVKVRWDNQLPVPHLLPVDPTIMCGPPWKNRTTCPDNRAVVHVHGSHGYDHSDGTPEQWFTPGFTDVGTQWQPNDRFGGIGTALFGGPSPVSTYVYPVDQEAATLWYHDHATGVTRLNAYAGLAGFFLVRDASEISMQEAGKTPPFTGIPAYPYETGIAIQDKTFWGVDDFTTSYIRFGQMAYPDLPNAGGGIGKPSITAEMFGNVMLVNGVAWPKMTVEPHKYRIRVLNGNDSRILILKLTTGDWQSQGDTFWIIGNEQGFLNAPVPVTSLTIMPGMRYDLILDFSSYGDAAGTPRVPAARISLLNVGPDGPYDGTAPVSPADPVYPMADPASTGQVMQFVVATPRVGTDVTLPAQLRPVTIPSLPAPGTAIPAKNLYLKEVIDNYGRLMLTLNNKPFFDAVTEITPLGKTEVWEVANITPDAHPIHLHLTKFRLIDREPIAQLNSGTAGSLLAPYPAIIPILPATTPQIWTYAGAGPATAVPPLENEPGWLDTFESKPGTLTRIQAKFDIPGVYVWHCHILSHEEYDMMRPLAVTTPAKGLTVISSFNGATVAIPAAGDTPPVITFTANALTGLTGNLPGTTVPAPGTTLAYEYQFTFKNPAGILRIVQPWSTVNACSIGGSAGNFPDAPGNWFLQVDARAIGASSRQASKTIGLIATYPIPVGLALNGPSTTSQQFGARIPVTYTATGLSALPSTTGPGPYEFRFTVRNAGRAVQASQPYIDPSSNTRNPGTFTWTPAFDQAPGVYTIQADVRTAGSSSTQMYSKILTYRIVGPAPVGVTLTADSTSQPASGAGPVRFTAAAHSALPNTVGAGPYEYQFWLKNAAGNVQLVQPWSQVPTWTWQQPPNIPGQYSVEVDARAVGGIVKDAVRTMPYVLTGMLQLRSLKIK